MTEKMMSARIQHKIDTSANWAKATSFIPKKGEIVIYSDLNKFKIGDGVKPLEGEGHLDFFESQTSVRIVTWEADD